MKSIVVLLFTWISLLCTGQSIENTSKESTLHKINSKEPENSGKTQEILIEANPYTDVNYNDTVEDTPSVTTPSLDKNISIIENPETILIGVPAVEKGSRNDISPVVIVSIVGFCWFVVILIVLTFWYKTRNKHSNTNLCTKQTKGKERFDYVTRSPSVRVTEEYGFNAEVFEKLRAASETRYVNSITRVNSTTSTCSSHFTENDELDFKIELFASGVLGKKTYDINSLRQKLKEFINEDIARIFYKRDFLGKNRGKETVFIHLAENPPAGIFVPFLNRSKIFVPYNLIKFSVCVILFVIFLNLHLFEDLKKNNCLAMLVFVSSLWATEALPLFITSVLIPILTLLLQITNDPQTNEDIRNVSKRLISEMMSSTVLLWLGAFSVSAALKKLEIAKFWLFYIIKWIGTNSRTFLMFIMFTTTFFSMWMTNSVATIFCLGLISPLLDHLDPGDSFLKSLVMGVALSANFGGFTTPVSSSQNMVAITSMGDNPIGWGVWTSLGIPIAVILNLLALGILIFIYKPCKSFESNLRMELMTMHEDFSFKQYYVIFVSLTSLFIWCADALLKDYYGNTGILAIIPLLALFGSGILDIHDFNNFHWAVIVVEMGGFVLSYAIRESHLMDGILLTIELGIGQQKIWVSLIALCAFFALISSFVSQSISSLLIMPIIKKVGDKFVMSTPIY
jgi:anion transporter